MPHLNRLLTFTLVYLLFAWLMLPCLATANASQSGVSGLTDFKVLANNDLGMHCVDRDYSVFSILPPYNVLNAQVVAQDANGQPVLLGPDQVELRYAPIADAKGSINSTSIGKSNFWDYADLLYGLNLAPGEGLSGLYMPKDAPSTAQHQFSWNQSQGLFKAAGIPIFPRDDAGKTNRYPLLRVTALDKASGKPLAALNTVAPVSDETDCSACHATGKQAARGTGWSNSPNLDVQSRTNILILHDRREKTDLQASQPVLCASCHYSSAQDLANRGPRGSQVGRPTLSAALHGKHANYKQIDGKKLYDEPAPVAGLPAKLNGVPPADQQTCYTCHPGKTSKCLRGAMSETLTCQNCHGNMKAVAGKTPLKAYGTIDHRGTDLQRQPWRDEPRCQSCHTGDAINHLTPSQAGITANLAADGIRLMTAFNRKDPAASPLLASNDRFAETPGKLFRDSKGHGGLACEACHGSTHAIWPGKAGMNDNKAAQTLQGHMGTVSACSTCHKPGSLPMTLDGPHGLHNIGDERMYGSRALTVAEHAEDDEMEATSTPRQNDSGDGGGAHPALFKRNPAACQACHGADLRGSALSRVTAERTYQTEWGVKTLKRGDQIGCYTCHNGPDSD